MLIGIVNARPPDFEKASLDSWAFGSFDGDGRLGGLAFACSSLVDSSLAEKVEFVRIGTKPKSIRDRTGLHRLPDALQRVWRVLFYCIFGRIHTVICFMSHGTSAVEKSLMVCIARSLGKRTILLPRSGHLETQLNRHKWFPRFSAIFIELQFDCCVPKPKLARTLSRALSAERHKKVCGDRKLA